MQIGAFEFNRPSSPIRFTDIEYLLSVAGKDIIRIAWNALGPVVCVHWSDSGRCSRGRDRASSCKAQVKRKALVEWFVVFFNLEKDCGQGNAVVNHLASLDLIISQRCVSKFGGFNGNKPKEWYLEECGPAFDDYSEGFGHSRDTPLFRKTTLS